MKKFLLLIAGIVLALGVANSTFAASSMLDYTYIDCVNGNDSIAEPFNSTKPYNSITLGIQNSINYINTNWNISSQAQNVLGKRFVIKVKSGCVYDVQAWIPLNFTTGQQYKNDIIIMSDSDNKMFGVKNIYFHGSSTSNIVFKNVDFMDQGASNPYFQISSMQWVKILDSIFRLRNNVVVASTGYGYPANFWIENSIIKIVWAEGNTNFTVPWYINNSKIDFTVVNGKAGKLTINSYYENKMNLIASTVIDVSGNELFSSADMINTKILNVKNPGFAWYGQVFINNSVSSTTPVVSTGWIHAYNNVFLGGFVDSSDIQNVRRNYTSAQGNTGIGWLYRKGINSYIEYSVSDRSLYKSITGNDLPNADSAVYIVFQ